LTFVAITKEGFLDWTTATIAEFPNHKKRGIAISPTK
jgi:hypothetical protein